MAFSKELFEHGYLFIDHRASPGLPEDIARQCGYDPKLCEGGKIYESSTMRCSHCGTHVVKNPFRTRERGYCAQCDDIKNGKTGYVCDFCAIAMRDPDYVHHPIEERIDLALTGKWALSGSMSRPVITPIGDLD